MILQSKDWALIAAEAASAKKAGDIVAIEVREMLVVTDFFVIATGTSSIQVRAIADEVEDQLRVRGGIKPIGREGAEEGKWLLLDYGDLVIHVFQPEERAFYRLEKLWSDAPYLELPESVTGGVSVAAASDGEPESARGVAPEDAEY